MLLSVIIPTCNRNDLLGLCLERLQAGAQAAGDFQYEVIVTDDGAANNAKQFIEQNHSWAKWVEGPKRGPAANRNNGAKQSNGAWIVFFDDDCLPDADVLLQYHTAIVQKSEVRVFEGAIYCNEEIKSPLYVTPVNLTGGYLWSCNFGIERSLFEQLAGFDEHFKYANLEDNDLHFRIKQLSEPVVFLPEARVEHPPRPMATPQKLARYHESWLYYHKKIGKEKTVADLLKTIFRNRLMSISKRPLSIDSFIAFRNLLIELWCTTMRYGFKKN